MHSHHFAIVIETRSLIATLYRYQSCTTLNESVEASCNGEPSEASEFCVEKTTAYRLGVSFRAAYFFIARYLDRA